MSSVDEKSTQGGVNNKKEAGKQKESVETQIALRRKADIFYALGGVSVLGGVHKQDGDAAVEVRELVHHENETCAIGERCGNHRSQGASSSEVIHR